MQKYAMGFCFCFGMVNKKFDLDRKIHISYLKLCEIIRKLITHSSYLGLCSKESPMKVTVLGAAGGIGQPLSLLLKLNLPAGSELSLYDVAPFTPGVAKDVSHIPTDVKVDGFSGDDLGKALEGADIVLIPAGVARKPGMTRADLFNINAGIVRDLVAKAAEVCPKARIGIITNPVNATVPIAAEVLKKAGVYDKRKLFGVTTLDVIRSETFIAELKNTELRSGSVSVIGGHSGTTILPLLSQVQHVEFSDEEIKSLTYRIQNAGTEVVEAKAGAGSATLSMAYAAMRFAVALVRAAQGENVTICSYVEGDGKFAPFFAQPVRLGKEGVEEFLPLGPLSAFEQAALDEMLPILRTEIENGVKFISEA